MMRALIGVVILTIMAGFLPARAETPVDDQAPVTITMLVPADAMVSFEGSRTTQTGTQRRFVSTPIATGKSLKYHIVVVAGDKTEIKRTLAVHGGERITLDCRGGQVRETRGTRSTASAASYFELAVPTRPRVVPLSPAGHVEQPYGFAGGIGDG
jgi:uncharacterized protein (TIGR03000 family)